MGLNKEFAEKMRNNRIVVNNWGQFNKFNQMWQWRVKGRVFIRADGTMTGFLQTGKLDKPLTNKYWRDMGYIYAIKVTPKDSMEAPENG